MGLSSEIYGSGSMYETSPLVNHRQSEQHSTVEQLSINLSLQEKFEAEQAGLTWKRKHVNQTVQLSKIVFF